eukprot:2220893-Amphidinium_carterae.1
MSAVTNFRIDQNSFKGTLPESGFRTMSEVTDFNIYENSLEGTLPERGIRTMSAVTDFCIHDNSLEGTCSHCAGTSACDREMVLHVGFLDHDLL